MGRALDLHLAAAYTGSSEVRQRFAELVQAIVAQMVIEAVQGTPAEGVH